MNLVNASKICSIKLVRTLWERQTISSFYVAHKIKPYKTLNDNTIQSYLSPDSFGLHTLLL